MQVNPGRNMADYRPLRPPDPYIQARSAFPAFAAEQPPISGPMTAPPAATATASTRFVSLPPMFILAVLVALIGIPIFLVAQGALTASKESLESHIKGTDTSGYGEGDDAGEDEGREKWKDKGDIGNGPLDISDLKGLGGLVGVAALIVISFAVFPDEIDGLWSGLVGGGVDIPLVGVVGGSGPVGPATPPDASPSIPIGGNNVYTDPRTGQQYPLPDDRYGPDPRFPPNGAAYGYDPRELPPGYSPELEYADPYAYSCRGLGGLFEGKSMMEMMMMCKIVPDLCEGMILPGMTPPSQTTQISIGGSEGDIDVTVDKGTGLSSEGFVMPTSSVERHMAMLRTQPILLIGYDPSIVPEDMLIYIAFGLLIPMLYAYGELLSNAYEHDDDVLIDDKVADVKERQQKEQRDAEGEKEVTDAELGYYKKLYEERKQEVNTLAERPWWAGSSWRPPWTEEDLEIEMEKDPDGVEMFRGAESWDMKRKKGFDGKFIPVKMGARFAEMNLKIKKLAANSELQSGKAEALKKRWDDDKKNFYPGMGQIEGVSWRTTSRGTLAKEAKSGEDAEKARQKFNDASVELAEARALLKAKKDPLKDRKGKETINPSAEKKKKYGFHLKLWDERFKDDDQTRDESLTPKALWLKKEGKTIGDMSLTAEQREMKALDDQIEGNKKLREERWKKDAQAVIAKRPGANAEERLFNVWKASDPAKATAWQQERQGQR